MDTRFLVYLIGYALVVGGVAFGMRAAGLSEQWVIAAALVLAGIGIIGAMSRAQRGGPPDETPI
jgi:hypothetical protein